MLAFPREIFSRSMISSIENGSGLMYNDSTYPQENGFGAHTFAMYGYPDYADALQPWFVAMSVTREGAGRFAAGEGRHGRF